VDMSALTADEMGT